MHIHLRSKRRNAEYRAPTRYAVIFNRYKRVSHRSSTVVRHLNFLFINGNDATGTQRNYSGTLDVFFLEIRGSVVYNTSLGSFTLMRRSSVIYSIFSSTSVINSRRMKRVMLHLRLRRRIGSLYASERIRHQSYFIASGRLQLRDRNAYSTSTLALAAERNIQVTIRHVKLRPSVGRGLYNRVLHFTQLSRLIRSRSLDGSVRSQISQVRHDIQVLRSSLRVATVLLRYYTLRVGSQLSLRMGFAHVHLLRARSNTQRHALATTQFTRSTRNLTLLRHR